MTTKQRRIFIRYNDGQGWTELGTTPEIALHPVTKVRAEHPNGCPEWDKAHIHVLWNKSITRPHGMVEIGSPTDSLPVAISEDYA